MVDTINWHEMYDNLREQHNESTQVRWEMFKVMTTMSVKIELLKRYAEENPTTETCEMLDILRTPMTYDEAKEKLKELEAKDEQPIRP